MEYPPAEVWRHLMMMDAANVARVGQARASGSLIAGPFARRMRDVPSAAKREQRVEVRFRIANALRCASKGGSSKQFLMLVRAMKPACAPLTRAKPRD